MSFYIRALVWFETTAFVVLPRCDMKAKYGGRSYGIPAFGGGCRVLLGMYCSEYDINTVAVRVGVVVCLWRRVCVGALGTTLFTSVFREREFRDLAANVTLAAYQNLQHVW